MSKPHRTTDKSTRINSVALSSGAKVLIACSIRDGLEISGPKGSFVVWREHEIAAAREAPAYTQAIIILAESLAEGYCARVRDLGFACKPRPGLFRLAYTVEALRDTLALVQLTGYGNRYTCLQALVRPEMAYVDAQPLWYSEKWYHKIFNGHRNMAGFDPATRGAANVHGHRSNGRRLIDFVAQELPINDDRDVLDIAKWLYPEAKKIFPRTTVRTLALKILEVRAMKGTGFIRR